MESVTAGYEFGLTDNQSYLLLNLENGKIEKIEDSLIIQKTENFIFEKFQDQDEIFSELTAFENRG